jgi:hypothetical protein
MSCLIYGADGTLTDEASDKLLLLDGCADAALEVAIVEHDNRLWFRISFRCVSNTCVW